MGEPGRLTAIAAALFVVVGAAAFLSFATCIESDCATWHETLNLLFFLIVTALGILFLVALVWWVVESLRSN